MESSNELMEEFEDPRICPTLMINRNIRKYNVQIFRILCLRRETVIIERRQLRKTGSMVKMEIVTSPDGDRKIVQR